MKNNTENDIKNLDILSTRQTVDVLLNEQVTILNNIVQKKNDLILATNAISKTIKEKGKIFIFGSSSNGRIAMLEAIEAQSNFGTNPDIIQGFMSGSSQAFLMCENEPDDSYDIGKADALLSLISSNDILIALCSNKNINYIQGLLDVAKEQKIKVILIGNQNNNSVKVDFKILLPFDDKDLFNVQSLNYTLFQKLILNILLTSAMSKVGKIYKEHLIDFKITNQQTKNEAIRLVTQITQTDETTAIEALKKCHFRPKIAITMLKHGINAPQAVKLLKKNNGILRKVIP